MRFSGNKWLFMLCTGFGLSALAGEAHIQGSATVDADPDCVSLQVTINSECYKTPLEASQAADTAAKNIYGFLKGLVNEGRDQISTNGGYTRVYERYVDGKRYCQGTYQKSTEIKLSVRNVPEFIGFFDKIQEKVFAESAAQSSDEDSSRTTVSISSPSPELFSEHEEALLMSARGKAVDNALRRFLASVPASCKITSYSIAGISEPAEEERGRYAKSAAGASMGSGNTVISFGKQSVTETVMVQINYDGGQCEPL
jgi:uncharacterized protein YggE